MILQRPGLLDADPPGITPPPPAFGAMLRTQRTDPALAARLPGLLGGLVHAPASSRPITTGWATVPMALLQGPARVDAWLGAGPVTSGQQGGVRWRHDDHHLFGAIDLVETPGTPLASLVQAGYADVFATLARTGFHHPLRLWNYLPHINADLDGLERYRHFNQGRQQAFLAAGQAAFEGAPAACALGSHGGPVGIRFLAARTPPLPLENPRQVSAYHYPQQYGPRSPSFSRAVLAHAGNGQWLLLISGTASIVGHATLHAGDLLAQIDETLANLRAVVDVARARGGADFRLEHLAATVHLRHAADLDRARDHLQLALGAEAPLLRGAQFLHADICRHDLLVEIEAHGLAEGAPLP